MKKIFKNEEGIISEEGEELASIDDVDLYLCVGGELNEGVFRIQEGVVDIVLEEENGYDIVLIENRNSGNESTNEHSIAS